MLGLIDFIDIFSSSEWIDIVTGILIPTLIIRHSSKSAKKQFKEQTRIAEEQLETQNLLSIKKEKRMFFTKLKLSKYESLHVALTEYMNLYYISYDNTYDCLVGLKTYNQYLDEHMASRENLAKKGMLLLAY